ncbi:MAG TPA: hypothetical protein VJC09_03195 [Candidatus Saccharimonadales bacterium]|nr:hypothetical protein [Candidatus Saccharimonadales bacterium]
MVRFAGEIPADFYAVWQGLGEEVVDVGVERVFFAGDEVNETGSINATRISKDDAMQLELDMIIRPPKTIYTGMSPELPRDIPPDDWII